MVRHGGVHVPRSSRSAWVAAQSAPPATGTRPQPGWGSIHAPSSSTAHSCTLPRLAGDMSYLLVTLTANSSHAPIRRLSVGKPLPGCTRNCGVENTYSDLPSRVLPSLSTTYSTASPATGSANCTVYSLPEHIARSKSSYDSTSSPIGSWARHPSYWLRGRISDRCCAHASTAERGIPP